MPALPAPLDSYPEFAALYKDSTPSEPAPLPTLHPTKPFWSYPGLSSDWPRDPSDPDGYKYANPYAREGSEDPLPPKADVVIIGSGITGVSVAYELSKLVRKDSQRTLEVVILEARDFCSGATARNGGHLAAHVAQGYSYLSKLYDHEEVKRCFEIEQHTVSMILSIIEENGWRNEVDLIDGGRNHLMFSENEFLNVQADFRECIDAGIIKEDIVQWFTAKETQEKYGTPYPMCRVPGYNLWPLKFVTKLFELAKGGDRFKQRNSSSDSSDFELLQDRVSLEARGLRQRSFNSLQSPPRYKGDVKVESSPSRDPYMLSLFTYTPVNAVVMTDENTWSIQTSRGTIGADYVIYATNAYTSHLLPQLSGPNGIVPVRGQVAAIRAKVGYEDEGWPTSGTAKGLSRSGWQGNQGFEYWFPRPNLALGRVMDDEAVRGRKPLTILGGGREALKDGGYGMYTADDSILDDEVSMVLGSFLSKLFPGQFSNGSDNTQTNGMEMEWSGIMGFSKSGDPLVGRVKSENGTVVPGQYISAGYTGHGMPRAYGCAEALASLLWSDITTPQAHWTPPDWLPRHYLTEAS